jgi:starch phosphorylase
VRQYAANHYVPAAAGYATRAGRQGSLGVEIADWQRKLAADWNSVAFGSPKVESTPDGCRFEIIVYPGNLGPDAVRVELFANGQNGGEPVRIPMDRGVKLADGGFLYSATATEARSPTDLTPRVMPYHSGASVPLEAAQILWQK